MIAGLIVVVVALFALVPATFAQGPVDSARPGMFGPGSGMMQQRGAGYGLEQGSFGRGAGLGLRIGGPENSVVAAAAEQVGLNQAELVAELQGGQTLAEVIVAYNGDPEQTLALFLAARGEKLAELVSSGQISQDQADAWLGTMTENATARLSQAWSPSGNGQGFVDADGDGVCDDLGRGQRGGRMMGQRWQ